MTTTEPTPTAPLTDADLDRLTPTLATLSALALSAIARAEGHVWLAHSLASGTPEEAALARLRGRVALARADAESIRAALEQRLQG